MRSPASPVEERVRSLWDVPEIQVLGLGFGLSLVWEILQSPFYADTFEVSWATFAYNRFHCTVGDALILLMGFWIVALIWGRSWTGAARWTPLATFVAISVAYTMFSEYINVHVVESWAYSRWMPTIAGIGLVPLLQWVVIPTIIVHAVRDSEVSLRPRRDRQGEVRCRETGSPRMSRGDPRSKHGGAGAVESLLL